MRLVSNVGHDLGIATKGGGALTGGTANNGQAAANASSPSQGDGVK